MYVCMYACVYVCMYVCVYVCMYVRMYVCMYVCMNVRMYVCMYVCVYVCTSIYVTNNKNVVCGITFLCPNSNYNLKCKVSYKAILCFCVDLKPPFKETKIDYFLVYLNSGCSRFANFQQPIRT